ncbi:condensation domain-containing protein [Streptomyces sp. NBC_01142]|uniref:condensation domain-containing protein n=1 Tax=Streptomyces sp. NBC_01142 TaxID=2975865 RepID=UPI00225B3704|nr:condensation domain-containing protein [Streptomyces sp. NBC_01142]MCX4826471.1 condensation domain-containing protein [Streptomyces sp. NBC_01142]
MTARSVIVETAPLSPGQERLIADEFARPGGVWPELGEPTRLRPIDTGAVLIDGPLDTRALQRAVSALIIRQPALCTRLHRLADTTPIQLVAGSLPDQVHHSLLSHGTHPSRETLLAQSQPLHVDPRIDPLFRTHLIRLGEHRHVLLLQIHHFVSDGWSIGILYRDLAELYNAARTGRPADLPPLPRTFAAVSRDMRTERRSPQLGRQLTFWRERLQHLGPAMAFTREPVEQDTGRRPVNVQRVHIPAPAVRGLRASARGGARGPLAGPFLAALALLLHHQSAATDIRIGMMISNRARPDTEHLIGYFVNTAVIRLRLHPELTAAGLTEAANEAVRQALEHQALPIQDLKRDLHQGAAPLYQVTLALNTMRTHTLTLDGADCQDIDMEETGPRTAPTTIEQRWVIEERAGALSGTLTYQAGTFTPPQIRMALGHLDQAIAAVTAGHPTVAAITSAFRHPGVRT